MKSTRNVTTSILLALSSSFVFVSANAQSSATQPSDASTPPYANTPSTSVPMGQGRGMHQGMGMGHGMKGQRSEMSKLMTPEERKEMQSKMQEAKTPEERQAIRTSMRTEMQKRAQDKGISMPEKSGGRHQANCHQAG